MTQYERMKKGLIYNPSDPEILKEQVKYQELLWEFNQLKPSQYEEKVKYMKEVFAECGNNCYIELPFRANWGGHNVHFGNDVYANYNLTIVDDGHVYVGNKVMFGPNVVIATANHPIEPSLRDKALQYNKDVNIGDNVWIGDKATILPNVTIGKGCIIAANAVVTRDIPEYSIAAGVPAKVIKTIR